MVDNCLRIRLIASSFAMYFSLPSPLLRLCLDLLVFWFFTCFCLPLRLLVGRSIAVAIESDDDEPAAAFAFPYMSKPHIHTYILLH